jgi:hypothetical protein
VSIFLARKISSVENLHSGNLYHEHSRTQHMASVVAPELDSIHIHLLEWMNGEWMNEEWENWDCALPDGS